MKLRGAGQAESRTIFVRRTWKWLTSVICFARSTSSYWRARAKLWRCSMKVTMRCMRALLFSHWGSGEKLKLRSSTSSGSSCRWASLVLVITCVSHLSARMGSSHLGLAVVADAVRLPFANLPSFLMHQVLRQQAPRRHRSGSLPVRFPVPRPTTRCTAAPMHSARAKDTKNT